MLRISTGLALALLCLSGFGVTAQGPATATAITSDVVADEASRLRRARTLYPAYYRARSKPRPGRGRALRYENLSDIEAREIERVALEINPGAIVTIAGVTVGCPCEDGPACTDQVWIVADNDARSLGLMLSRIDGKWVVGPIQQWWLDRAAITRRFDTARERTPEKRWAFFAQELDALQQLDERFPKCAARTP